VYFSRTIISFALNKKAMKTKFISYMALGLLGLVLACKDKAEPQPDWTSAFVGTYKLSSADIELVGSSAQGYGATGLLTLDRKDNQTLILNLSARTQTGPIMQSCATTTIFPSYRYINLLLKAVNESKWVVEGGGSVYDDNGKLFYKLDSLTKPESGNYLNLSFSCVEGRLIKIKRTISLDESKSKIDFRYYYPKSCRGNGPSSLAVADRGMIGFYAYSLEGLVYKWDFGDGTTGEGEVVTHQYRKNGFYTARLLSPLPSGTTASKEGQVYVSNAE
jgi:hypothetical protein